MDVTQVGLETRRQISVTQLEIHATYGGFLEGYPCARVNDIMILAPCTPATGTLRRRAKPCDRA